MIRRLAPATHLQPTPAVRTGHRRLVGAGHVWSGLVLAGRLFVQFVRPMTTALVLVQGWFALVLLGGSPAMIGRSEPAVPGLSAVSGVSAVAGLSAVPVLAAVVALACWYAHAVAVNDLTDVATDRVNLRGTAAENERPLVNGAAGRRDVQVLTVGLAVAAGVATVLVDVRLLVAWPAMLGLNYAYSRRPVRLAGRGGLAQLVLPLGYVVVPSAYAWALLGFPVPRPGALIALAGLYVMFAGRLMLKDVRDVRGDRAVGKRTFLVRHGLRATVLVAGVALLCGAAVMAGGLILLVPLGRVVALGVAGVAGALGAGVALRAVLREDAVASQLRWVGVIGRLGTGWLFCCFLSLLVPGQGVVAYVAQLIVAVALFAVSLRLVADPGASRRTGQSR